MPDIQVWNIKLKVYFSNDLAIKRRCTCVSVYTFKGNWSFHFYYVAIMPKFHGFWLQNMKSKYWSLNGQKHKTIKLTIIQIYDFALYYVQGWLDTASNSCAHKPFKVSNFLINDWNIDILLLCQNLTRAVHTFCYTSYNLWYYLQSQYL